MGKFTVTQIDKILALGVFYLATKGTCGNPRVRPISSYIVHNGKLYFGTSKNKNLYKHIEQHSGVEICIVNHLDAKEALMAKYKRIAQSFDNNPAHPNFAIFYLENISAQLQDFSGNILLYKEN